MPNRVSVIIPAYNIATYITEAVESVLAQTYPNLEVIVINNGSEDNTAEVLQPYRDRIRYEHFVENQGIAGAYNRGLEVASGDYIACLDGDDYYIYPPRIAEQAALLDAHATIDIVSSGWQTVAEDGALQQEFTPWQDLPLFDPIRWMVEVPIHLQAMLIRRELFARVGNFKPRYSIAAGNYIGMRMIALGAEIVWHRQVTVAHRFREASISQVQIPQQIDAEVNSRIELFGLDEVPQHIKAIKGQVIPGHALWSVTRLIHAGYPIAEAAPYIQVALEYLPLTGIRAACNALTQLLTNLNMGELSEEQWADLLAAFLEDPNDLKTRELLQWWGRVWWVYADRLHSHPLTEDERRHRAQQALADYAAQASQLARAALYAEPWAVSQTSLKQFAQDAAHAGSITNTRGFMRGAYWTLVRARVRQGGVRSTLQAIWGLLTAA